MPGQDSFIAYGTTVVRIARFVNHAFLAAVTVGIAVSLAAPATFCAALLSSIPTGDLASALTGARLLLLIGIAMSFGTDRILRAIAALLESTRRGDPFASGNVGHLYAIGWSLLGLQALELPAALLRTFFPGMGSAAPSGDISIVGWMAVLMVFALTRVYRAGATMRADLDGTV